MRRCNKNGQQRQTHRQVYKFIAKWDEGTHTVATVYAPPPKSLPPQLRPNKDWISPATMELIKQRTDHENSWQTYVTNNANQTIMQTAFAGFKANREYHKTFPITRREARGIFVTYRRQDKDIKSQRIRAPVRGLEAWCQKPNTIAAEVCTLARKNKHLYNMRYASYWQNILKFRHVICKNARDDKRIYWSNKAQKL